MVNPVQDRLRASKVAGCYTVARGWWPSYSPKVQLDTGPGTIFRVNDAYALDVSAPFLSDVEHDRRSTDKIPELAKALGCDVEVLENLDPRMKPDTKLWLDKNPEVARFLTERESRT